MDSPEVSRSQPNRAKPPKYYMVVKGIRGLSTRMFIWASSRLYSTSLGSDDGEGVSVVGVWKQFGVEVGLKTFHFHPGGIRGVVVVVLSTLILKRVKFYNFNLLPLVVQAFPS